MKAWILRNKGYLFHIAAVSVVFMDPSVQHYFSSHSAASAALATVWGVALHWADGK